MDREAEVVSEAGEDEGQRPLRRPCRDHRVRYSLNLTVRIGS